MRVVFYIHRGYWCAFEELESDVSSFRVWRDHRREEPAQNDRVHPIFSSS